MVLKKRFDLLILGCVVVLFLIPVLSANFVCGYVNSSEDLEASWFDVDVYYSEDFGKSTTCKVGPENKYCCDPSEIEGVSWNIDRKSVV